MRCAIPGQNRIGSRRLSQAVPSHGSAFTSSISAIADDPDRGGLALLLLDCSCRGWASVPTTERANDGQAKYPSGLVLELDGRGIEAAGYRPIQVNVSTWPPGRKLKADRQVRVVLSCHGDDYRRITQVSQVIELPEGSTGAKANVLVPQTSHFSTISIETYEGGQQLDDLSQEVIGWPTTNNFGWNWTESRPAMLFIDSNAPSREEQIALVQAYQTSATDSLSETLPDVRQLLSLFPETNQPNGGLRGPVRARAPIPDPPRSPTPFC